MNSNEKISAFFDYKASSFDAIYSGEKNSIAHIWDKLTRQNIYSRLDFTMKSLRPVNDKKILDVGCGSGRYCIEIAKAGAKEVTGIDLSPKMLEIAEQLADQSNVSDQCRFIRKDILEIQNSFDDIIALGFFDYIRNSEQVFSHLRTLNRGKLIASFPCILSPRVPFRKIWLNLSGCPVYFYSKSGILRLCKKADFECKTLIKSGPIYLLVAE